MLVGLDEEAGRVEIGENALARLVAVEPGVDAAFLGDGGIRVHDVDLRAVVACADLEVVRVVRGRDLHGTRAELGST